MNATRRSRNRAVAAVDQLEAQLDEALSKVDLEMLCALVDNVTLMADASAKDGPSIALMGDRRLWRIMAACTMAKLNAELVKRHDAEVADVND